MKFQGGTITEDEARSRFQQMKAGYDILSDPKKRQIYDALGHQGMDFVINPSHAWDPHVLLGNLAKSSVMDRAKLMTLVLVFFGLVLMQPILICAKVDQMLEYNGGALIDSSWVALLVPFWMFAVFYGVVMVIGKAVFPLVQWISFVIGVLLLTLKFDKTLDANYSVVFIPFYLWMFLRIAEARHEMNAVKAAMSKMVTIDYIEKYILNEKDEDGNDIEGQLHRNYNDLSSEERDKINENYIIVHVPPKAATPGEDEDPTMEDDLEQIERSPEYQEAVARDKDAYKSIQRIILPEIPLLILIIIQLDQSKGWNWGLVFLPLWISMFFECCGGCYGFFCLSSLAHIEAQETMAAHFAKRHPKSSRSEEKDEGGDHNTIPDAEKNVGEGVAAKVEDGTNVMKSDTDDTVETGKGEDADLIQKTGIDVAVTVVATTDAKPAAAKKESGVSDKDEKKHDETETPEFDDDFIRMMMENMDDETFQYYQQQENEAENKATEAQSKAIGSFCNIIFQILLAALFVVKLNQVYGERDEPEMEGTDSFSTFWILFPFLLVAGCTVCCCACAIFCASDIDVQLSGGKSGNDDGENEDGDNDEDETAETSDNPVIIPAAPVAADVEAQKVKTPNSVNAAANTAVPTPAAAETKGDDPPESDMDDLD